MEIEEPYYLYFSKQIVPFQRYGFGSNYTIQTRRTKRIVVYPYWATPNVDMRPGVIFINNQQWTVLPAEGFPSVLLSIALRSGGFLYIDYPLTSLFVTDQIHPALELDADIDFNNSYIIFTGLPFLPFGFSPFVIPFGFRLRDPKATLLHKL
jgi:hypothetical protein